VDCDYNNYGCQGGSEYLLYKFARDNGFYLKNDYFYKHYLGAKRSCMSTKSKNKVFKKSIVPKGYHYLHANEIINIV